MNILVLESDPGAAAATEAELTAAGHTIVRCHEPEAPSFPCVGVTHQCPIDSTDVAVAVVVRGETHPDQVTATEDGTTCALRRFVPVVVTGHHEFSPIVPFARALTAGPETIVAAVEHVAGEPPPAHREAAERMYREVLDRHGFDAVPAEVNVRRSGGRVRVELTTPADLPPYITEIASVRVAGAIRKIDEHAAGISVTFTPA